MMAGNLTVKVEIKIRWWVRLYLKALMLFCLTFNTFPDIEKVARFVVKYGFRIRAAGKAI